MPKQKTPKKVKPKKAKSKSMKFEEIFSERAYVYAVGRRKSATAQVRLYTGGKGRIYTNKREYRRQFPYFEHQKTIARALDLIKEKQTVDISAKVTGGGLKSQTDAISLGIARSLAKGHPEYREKLKAAGYLSRDARIKERKKPGLKRARRAPQWQKR